MKSVWVSAALSGVISNLNETLLKSGFETQECFLSSSMSREFIMEGGNFQGIRWDYELSFK